MAIDKPADLLSDFTTALQHHELASPAITHSLFQAGKVHTSARRGPPVGNDVVYVFSLSDAYGKTCPAGPHRALRVGKATSTARLTQNYIHYPTGLGLPSKLATYRVMWPMLNLVNLGPTLGTNWEAWINDNLDRDQFEVPTGNDAALGWLEKYVRARLGPVFEG